ncbi:MAG: MBL fold metallo-hydrolase [Planctomycetes bacterium]|nr:MBL fold metallo-hydrolase [Planctomycetota bacterium]MCP4771801.1 MBL fold metallo-hydrolase [Planctomycetota bacterium]MCP4860956.1 MBL fold metallo-hydrolase [Planctomycetota bacterium]
MLVHHFRDPHWLVNSYLVADRPGGRAVLIDSGGPLELIETKCEELQVQPELLLCTHRHPDHITHNRQLVERFSLPVAAHREEATFIPMLTQELEHEARLQIGELAIQTRWVPGHTAGHMAYVINQEAVFTGDVLFAGSVGGTRGSGHTTIEDLRESVMQQLMTLPPQAIIYPGHMDSTTVVQEWEHNPFVRWWRGLEQSVDLPCTAAGLEGTLLLRALDYDGGTKCLVRFADGTEDLVPGSKVVEITA